MTLSGPKKSARPGMPTQSPISIACISFALKPHDVAVKQTLKISVSMPNINFLENLFLCLRHYSQC